MLEEILDYRNIHKALVQVTRNKGSGGVDGMETVMLSEWLRANWRTWKASILEGSYRPLPVRKVEIPKSDGVGKRLLGIPCVKDRLLQQAISQWLTPKYESMFSTSSYGFRQGRNAHQAVIQAQRYVNEGKDWVIELDLEKFFDRVNHDKLMSRLSVKIDDKRTLKLIRRYLNSGIMEGGLMSVRTEGVPQGSPLSPVLSNIVLNDLDKELEARGHSFVRYADDVSVYVRSEKAGRRTMDGVIGYLWKALKLKVNVEKSSLCRPSGSHLLGFTFYWNKTSWEIGIANRSLKRVREKMRTRTSRKSPTTAREKIKQLEEVIKGWVEYFRIAKCGREMKSLDKMVRHRLRMGIWKQWKSPATRIRNLIKLGIDRKDCYRWGMSNAGYCRAAHSKAMKIGVSNRILSKAGYIGFSAHYYYKTQHQLPLF